MFGTAQTRHDAHERIVQETLHEARIHSRVTYYLAEAVDSYGPAEIILCFEQAKICKGRHVWLASSHIHIDKESPRALGRGVIAGHVSRGIEIPGNEFVPSQQEIVNRRWHWIAVRIRVARNEYEMLISLPELLRSICPANTLSLNDSVVVDDCSFAQANPDLLVLRLNSSYRSMVTRWPSTTLLTNARRSSTVSGKPIREVVPETDESPTISPAAFMS